MEVSFSLLPKKSNHGHNNFVKCILYRYCILSHVKKIILDEDQTSSSYPSSRLKNEFQSNVKLYSCFFSFSSPWQDIDLKKKKQFKNTTKSHNVRSTFRDTPAVDPEPYTCLIHTRSLPRNNHNC